MEVGLNTVSNVTNERLTYEKTGNKKIDDFYSGMSAAAEKSKSHAKGNALALTMLPYSDSMSYGMAAFDSDMSTQEDPIIKISVNYGGEQRYYDVHVNEVDPRNASAVEMFALSAYMDENGMTDRGTFGSFNKMKVYGQNASEFGDFPDLQSMDGYNVRTDWIKMLRQMAEAYLGNPNTYEQSLDANKLADVLERVSEKQIGNLISSITINSTIQLSPQEEKVEDNSLVKFVSKTGEEYTVETTNDVQEMKLNIKSANGDVRTETIRIDQIQPTAMSFKELIAFSGWMKERMNKGEIWDNGGTLSTAWGPYEYAGKEFLFDISSVSPITYNFDEKVDYENYFKKQYDNDYHMGDMPNFYMNIQMHHALYGQGAKREGCWDDKNCEDLVTFGECSNVYKYSILNSHTHNVDVSVSWSPKSTKENPVMLVTRYGIGKQQETHEVSINEVDPSNASYLEMHAVYAYDATVTQGMGSLDFLVKTVASDYQYDDLTQKKDWYKEIQDACKEMYHASADDDEKAYYINGAINTMLAVFDCIHNPNLPERPVVPRIQYQLFKKGRVEKDYIGRLTDGIRFKIQDDDGEYFTVFDKTTGKEKRFSYSRSELYYDEKIGKTYLVDKDFYGNMDWIEGDGLQDLLKEFFQFDELKAGKMTADVSGEIHSFSTEELDKRVKRLVEDYTSKVINGIRFKQWDADDEIFKIFDEESDAHWNIL